MATDSLTDRFLHQTRGDIPRLMALLERAHTGDRAVLKEIERIVHSIHGAGALFGFPRLSAAAGLLELLVEEAIANASAAPAAEAAVLQQLMNHAQRLAQEVEAAGKAPPRGDGLFQGGNTGT